jgi:chromosome partitioning protein
MHILAVANQKGGVGKTTATVNLAAALSRAKRSVLLVDLDPQASLTEYFLTPAKQADLQETVFNLLVDARPLEPLQLGPLIALLPATIDLAAAEIQLPSKRGSERALVRMLRNYHTDYCLIDCPPSLGILTTNGLAAAHRVLIPVTTELMAERTVRLILASIKEVLDAELSTEVRPWRLLPSIYDSRLAHHKEILEALRVKYGPILYPEPVKATTRYKDSVTEQVDISELDKTQGVYWDRLALALIAEMEGSDAQAE